MVDLQGGKLWSNNRKSGEVGREKPQSSSRCAREGATIWEEEKLDPFNFK